MNIKKANLENINHLLAITQACGKVLAENNIYQWNEKYPSKEAFLTDLEREELYILEVENTIVGCITISTFMDEEYKSVDWLTSNENNIYIHRLAVHPNYQGKGFAQSLMTFAENYAKENNFQSVRLDTFSQNPRNLKFYPKRGYEKTGEIYFPRIKEYSFHCFELIL